PRTKWIRLLWLVTVIITGMAWAQEPSPDAPERPALSQPPALARSARLALAAPQKPTPAPVRNMRTEEMRKRWESLSPEEQEAWRRRYEQFKSLPAAQQQQLQKDFKDFQNRSPQEKQMLIRNHRRLQALDPISKRQFDENYRRWLALPEHRKMEYRK